METAFLLASFRRAARRPDALPLGPIRSLHYFLPVIEELLAQPVPESYLAYLRSKVTLRPTAGNTPSTRAEPPPRPGTGLCSNFYVFKCAPTLRSNTASQ